MTETSIPTEHEDLLETLAEHRRFLRFTVNGLTDEQAARRSTASELCLGGLIKHVAATEEGWASFIVQGTEALAMEMSEAAFAAHNDEFRMLPGETLADLLAAYDAVAARTDALLTGGIDLNASHPLPEAPWFEPGASWSARRVLLHVIAETAQHAGHADIIRETIDGAKTMG
jgi:Protein of unknown function (DUF664)